jgi:low molecular weight protein-tyrosine phosphatase
MNQQGIIKVLFVCTGNICRSPTAEAVLLQRVAAAGLADRIKVDSAGTHDFHVGDAPDPRAQETAARRGYDLSKLRGRQVIRRDFVEFDYVLAMDHANVRALALLCPAEHAQKLRLIMEFARGSTEREVPDPYNGGSQDFDWVLDLLEAAMDGLLEHLRAQLETRP